MNVGYENIGGRNMGEQVWVSSYKSIGVFRYNRVGCINMGGIQVWVSKSKNRRGYMHEWEYAKVWVWTGMRVCRYERVGGKNMDVWVSRWKNMGVWSGHSRYEWVNRPTNLVGMANSSNIILSCIKHYVCMTNNKKPLSPFPSQSSSLIFTPHAKKHFSKCI